jgi:hypothetical protein
MLDESQTGSLVRSIARLRKAHRLGSQAVRDEIEPVLAHLEGLVGQTVSRAEAARLLGISQTALDRWVAKGELASVLTPRGRREVPLAHVVDLIERIEAGNADVASVMRDRRRAAETITTAGLLPRQHREPGLHGHRRAELHSLAYHRAVARHLDEAMVGEARRRLSRWRQQGRIHPRWAREWERVLALPVSEISRTIGSDTPRARQLRQSSPFAGMLTEQERRRILDAVAQATA